MRILAVILAAVVALGAAARMVLWRLSPPTLLVAPERGAAFENVTVIEPGLSRMPGWAVRVAGARIAAIEDAAPATAPAGYLLPGLIDSHVHGADESIAGQADLFRTLYLAHGITTIRNTGGGLSQLDERERIARGEIAGPRIFACGPLVDGAPPIWQFGRTLEDPGGAAKLVEGHAAAGFDCLKVYERLRPGVLSALVEEAHRNGLPVVGHVPQRVRYEDASIDDVQHMRGLARIDGREPILDRARNLQVRTREWAELSAERIELAVRVSLEQGIAHTPTLVLYDRGRRMQRPAELIAEPDMQLLPRFYGDLTWDPRGTLLFDAIPADSWREARRVEPNAKRLVLALHRAGVRIHAGTDVGNPFLVPGASLQEELRHLVDAGLTPEEAWVTATRWPGEFLREPGLGRIEEGAPADLLLFRDDPTRDLAALGSLEAVVADGRLYSREALDAALATARTHYRGWLYERVSMAIGERQRAEVLRGMREQTEQ